MFIDSLKLKTQSFPSTRDYPFCVPSIRMTPELQFTRPVTFFIGENGSGKSTLLQAISRKCNIHIWSGLEHGRVKHSPFEELLHEFIDLHSGEADMVGAFFASDIFRNFAVLVDEWATSDPGLLRYFGGASLLTQSHGQSHLAFFENRFMLRGLYLLDEPETALSPKSQVKFLEILRKSCATGNTQFIIATHSPILLSCADAAIFSFDHAPAKELSYKETELFRLYNDFLQQF
jgi:predicted ATPase